MKPPIEKLPSHHLLSICSKGWGLENLMFVRKMENIVFSCDSPSGKAFLRLTSPLRRSRAEIEAEIHWIEHLAKSGLSIPRIIPDKHGHKIISLNENEYRFEAVVFSAISGEHPSEEIVISDKFLKTLGSLIAKMHLGSENYTHCHFKREEWNEERGIRHALTACETTQENELKTKFKNTITELENLPRTTKNYGLIHADLGALNLFIDDEGISIIDFDDSCYHWFVFDLAIVIFSMIGRFKHISIQQSEKKWLAALLEGYQTIRPLSNDEIEQIPQLIKFACLRLFFWIEFHQNLGTFHADSVETVAQLKEWAKAAVKARY